MFKTALREKLQELPQCSQYMDRWLHVSQAYQKTGKEVAPRDHEKMRCYISDETWKLICYRKELKQRNGLLEIIVDVQRGSAEYHTLDRKVKNGARRDRRAWYNSLADRAEKAAESHDSRTTYRITKIMSK
jgi:hypothetical protein